MLAKAKAGNEIALSSFLVCTMVTVMSLPVALCMYCFHNDSICLESHLEDGCRQIYFVL